MKRSRILSLILAVVMTAAILASCGAEAKVNVDVLVVNGDEELINTVAILTVENPTYLDAFNQACADEKADYQVDEKGTIISVNDVKADDTHYWALKSINGDENVTEKTVLKDGDSIVVSYMEYEEVDVETVANVEVTVNRDGNEKTFEVALAGEAPVLEDLLAQLKADEGTDFKLEDGKLVSFDGTDGDWNVSVEADEVIVDGMKITFSLTIPA